MRTLVLTALVLLAIVAAAGLWRLAVSVRAKGSRRLERDVRALTEGSTGRQAGGPGTSSSVTFRDDLSSSPSETLTASDSREIQSASHAQGTTPRGVGGAEQIQAGVVSEQRGGEESRVEDSGALLVSRLWKARAALGAALGRVLGRSSMDSQAWDALEEALLAADVGVKITMDLVAWTEAEAKRQRIGDPAGLIELVRDRVVAMLEGKDRELRVADTDPTVYVFVGVNGTGKTTSIAKMAKLLGSQGKGVVLAAADTFRAAAAEQLELWAERVGARIVRGSEGGDPGAVVFDAVGFARARGAGFLLVDTAGRLHTNVNLMEELRKIVRVAEKAGAPPSEVLLVIDATTGQNGMAQASKFKEAVDVTGIVLTKLDGTAKGGIVLAIEEELGVPVKLVGLGEGEDDLVPFDPRSFAEGLFGYDSTDEAAGRLA